MQARPPVAGGLALCRLAERAQGTGPLRETGEHPAPRLDLPRAWRTPALTVEVVEGTQRHLRADAGHPELGRDQSQVLDRPYTALGAVTDEANGLVPPLGVEVIEGVLEHGGRGVVVFRGHEHVRVEAGDQFRPCLRALEGVAAEGRRCRFGQHRRSDLGKVHQHKVEIIVRVRADPFRDRPCPPVRTRTAGEHGDPRSFCLHRISF